MKWQPFKNIRQRCRYWLLHRLPSCEELLPIISQKLDHKISVHQWITLNLHLFVCKWCLDYAKQLSFLRHAARIQTDRIDDPKNANELPLSAEAKERIKRSLSEG